MVSSAHSAHAAKETRWQTTCGETAPGLPASFGHSHAFSGLTRRLGVPVPGPMNGRTPDTGARAKSRRDGRGDRRAARESRGGREGLRRRQEASGQDEALNGKESRPTILSDWGITLDQVHGRESSWIKGVRDRSRGAPHSTQSTITRHGRSSAGRLSPGSSQRPGRLPDASQSTASGCSDT